MNATRYLPFAGRVLIGIPFAMSGINKLAAYGATTEMISAVGLPAPPLAFVVAVAVELGGGLLLIAGFQARLVAIALALFALATAVSFHSNFADLNQMFHFLKNIMIAGPDRVPTSRCARGMARAGPGWPAPALARSLSILIAGCNAWTDNSSACSASRSSCRVVSRCCPSMIVRSCI